MSKIKIFWFIIALLIISNVSLLYLGNFNQGKKSFEKNQGPKELIIKRLGFNADQEAEYLEKVKIHHSKSKELKKNTAEIKQELYALLNTTIDGSIRDSLINEISIRFAQMEELNFNHFQEIKNICNENQLEDFEKLSKDFGKIFSKKPPLKRRGKLFNQNTVFK